MSTSILRADSARETPRHLDQCDIGSGLTVTHLQWCGQFHLACPGKRLFDLVLTPLILILLLPILFYLAVAVKLSSRGPVLYTHERIGRGGRRFRVWKFRTMFELSDRVLDHWFEQYPELRCEWDRDQKLRYDPRTTRIGRFMRRLSLDELPQLWNVMRGEMSLVGPRPIVESEISKYADAYELYKLTKPGITGLWQVSGRNNTSYEDRVQLDAYYIRNWSPWMDGYLLLRTIWIVLLARGAY